MSDRKILIEVSTNAQKVNKEIDDLNKVIKQQELEQQRLNATLRQGDAPYHLLAEAIELNKKKAEELEKTLVNLEQENRQSINSHKQIQSIVSETVKNEGERVTQNEKLLNARAQLNLNDANYIDNLKLINDQLEENNNMLQKVGEGKAAATTIAEFTDQIGEAFQSINVFNVGITDFVSRAQNAGGAGKLFKNALSEMKDGITGIGKAIAANPLGMLLSLLAPIVQKMMEFAPLTNALEQAMATLAPVLNLVKKPIEIMAGAAASAIEWITGLVASTTDATQAALDNAKAEEKLNNQKVLQERINENVKKQVDDLIEQSKEETSSIETRTDALIKAQEQEELNIKSQIAIAAESLRLEEQKLAQKRDLNNEELKLLDTGTQSEIEALMRKKGITREELDMLEKAKLEKMRIDQDLLNAGEKYTTALKALNTEREKSDTSIRDKSISLSKERLELFKTEYDAHKHSTAERIKFEEDYATRAKAILKSELDAKKLSYERYRTEVLRIDQQLRDNKNEIGKQQLQDAMDFQKATLDYYVQTEGEKAKNLNQELAYIENLKTKKLQLAETEFNLGRKTAADSVRLSTERKRIEQEAQKSQTAATIANAEQQLQYSEQMHNKQKQLQAKVTTESLRADADYLENVKIQKLAQLEVNNQFNFEQLNQKYQNGAALTEAELQYITGVQQINNDFETAKKELKNQQNSLEIQDIQERYEAKKASAATSFEQERIASEERYQITHAELQQQLNEGKISQEEFNAQETKAKKAKAEEDKKTDSAVFENRLNLASQTFANLQTILGKESAAGKAMPVAQATIDTYKSAVSAYSAMSVIPIVGPALGAVAAAAAVAAGIQNVKKITATKTPKAEKGALFSIGGKRHSAGGTLFTGEDGTRFEAEAGEVIGVMNRNAARHFMAFNNAFPAGSGSAPNYFASGGIVSREVAQHGINTDELAAKIAQANATIPAPVVAIADIINRGDSYIRVKEGANF